MMRLLVAFSICAALGGHSLPGQDAPLPELASARPLDYPQAPGALAGLTVCLTLDHGEQPDIAVRAMHYLARLLEEADASVAVVATSEPDASLVSIIEDAGAALVLRIGWHANGDGAVLIPFEDRQRRQAERLQMKFIALLRDDGMIRRVGNRRSSHVPRVPDLGFVLGGTITLHAHREPVHTLFSNVVAWWAAVGEAAQKLAESVSGSRDGPDSNGDRAIDPLWPLDRPPESDAEVAAFLTNWRRAKVADSNQVWLDVKVTRRDGKWVLSGSTELPLLEGAVRDALARIGVAIARGALRKLPDTRRLGGAPFGIVSATSVQTWSRPGRATGMRGVDPDGQYEETDLLRGEPVWLLDRENDALLVHAASGYLGWVRESDIERVDEATFREALVGADDKGELVARRALARLGTPYLFGGRGENGIDCSGLAGTSWATEGVFMPRDAGQQILAGQLVATVWKQLPLEPGDLLFFASSSGRIRHVGVSLGGSRFVHATDPEVTVGSLDPSDPYYSPDAEDFVLAKRVGR